MRALLCSKETRHLRPVPHEGNNGTTHSRAIQSSGKMYYTQGRLLRREKQSRHLECLSLGGFPPTVLYTLPCTPKFRQMEFWDHASFGQPHQPMIIAITETNKLVLYNARTGKLEESYNIGDDPKFKELTIDVDNGRILLKSNQQTKNRSSNNSTSVFLTLLVFSYAPLSFVAKIELGFRPFAAERSIVDAEVVNGMLILMHCNKSMTMYDFNEVLKEYSPGIYTPNSNIRVCDDPTLISGFPITACVVNTDMRVRKLLKTSTDHRYIQFGTHPLRFITNKDNGDTAEVRDAATGEVEGTVSKASDSIWDALFFHPDQSPRLINLYDNALSIYTLKQSSDPTSPPNVQLSFFTTLQHLFNFPERYVEPYRGPRSSVLHEADRNTALALCYEDEMDLIIVAGVNKVVQSRSISKSKLEIKYKIIDNQNYKVIREFEQVDIFIDFPFDMCQLHMDLIVDLDLFVVNLRMGSHGMTLVDRIADRLSSEDSEPAIGAKEPWRDEDSEDGASSSFPSEEEDSLDEDYVVMLD